MSLLTRIGESKMAMAGVVGLAGMAGLTKSVARPTIDLAGEAAFGDENADRYFLGERGISPGSLLDAHLGSGAAAAGSIAGLGVGAAVGGGLGAMARNAIKDAKFANDVKIPKTFSKAIPLLGEKEVPLLGRKNFI